MAAFSASRLVWPAIPEIVATIVSICRLRSPRPWMTPAASLIAARSASVEPRRHRTRPGPRPTARWRGSRPRPRLDAVLGAGVGGAQVVLGPLGDVDLLLLALAALGDRGDRGRDLADRAARLLAGRRHVARRLLHVVGGRLDAAEQAAQVVDHLVEAVRGLAISSRAS